MRMLTEPLEPELEPPCLPQVQEVQEALTAMPLPTATTATIPSSSRTLP